MYETGYWDDKEKSIKSFVEISMCGCSKENRLTGKELEERHHNLSKNYYEKLGITKTEYFEQLKVLKLIN